METFEFNLSMKELEQRTHKDYLVTKKFLKMTISYCYFL